MLLFETDEPKAGSSSGSERVVTFLNDLNLAALSIAIVIFVCYVLARARGLEKQPPIPRTYRVTIENVTRVNTEPTAIDPTGFQFDIFALIDGKLVRPGDPVDSMSMQGYGTSNRKEDGLPESSPNWFVEFRDEFKTTDRLIFHLVNVPDGIDANDIAKVTYKISPSIDGTGGQTLTAERSEYFFAAVSIENLIADVNPINDADISLDSLPAHSLVGNVLPTHERSNRLDEIGRSGELYNNDTSGQSYADFRHLDVSFLPDLTRNQTCTVLFNHLEGKASAKNGIASYSNGNDIWHARLLLESFPAADGGRDVGELTKFLKPIEDQLTEMLKSIYPYRTTGEEASQDRWHLHSYPKDSRTQFLFVQSLRNAPLIHSRAVWLDVSGSSALARWVFLSPGIRDRLTSNDRDIVKEEWEKVRLKISEAFNKNSKIPWICLSEKQVAYAASQGSKTMFKISSLAENGSVKSVEINPKSFPQIVLGTGNSKYLESSWWSESLKAPKFLVMPTKEEQLTAVIAMLLILTEDDPKILTSLGLRQNPILWGQYE